MFDLEELSERFKPLTELFREVKQYSYFYNCPKYKYLCVNPRLTLSDFVTRLNSPQINQRQKS